MSDFQRRQDHDVIKNDDLKSGRDLGDASMLALSSALTTREPKDTMTSRADLCCASVMAHIDQKFEEIQQQNRDLAALLREESQKRTNIEQTFRNMLLTQNEVLLELELRLFRLESKKREQTPLSNKIAGEASKPLLASLIRPKVVEGMTSFTLGDTQSEAPIQDKDENLLSMSRESNTMPKVSTQQVSSNPSISEASGFTKVSSRVFRGESDAHSTLDTFATSNSIHSTVVTPPPRHLRRFRPEQRKTPQQHQEDSLHKRQQNNDSIKSERNPLHDQSGTSFEDFHKISYLPVMQLSSFSNSPLTLPSGKISSKDGQRNSGVNETQGTSIISSRPPSIRSIIRATRHHAMSHSNGVVSLDETTMNENSEGDSLSIVDDNLFNTESARSWHKEYEARLEALQKRWATE